LCFLDADMAGIFSGCNVYSTARIAFKSIHGAAHTPHTVLHF